jgi:hypothetical protein
MPLRFAYTRPNGGVSIVSAAPKAHLERLIGEFGPLSDADYRDHVLRRSIPAGAANASSCPTTGHRRMIARSGTLG